MSRAPDVPELLPIPTTTSTITTTPEEDEDKMEAASLFLAHEDACGISLVTSPPSERLTSLGPATRGQHPWAASLHRGQTRLACLGTVIGPRVMQGFYDAIIIRDWQL